jgi:hypothetical protein
VKNRVSKYRKKKGQENKVINRGKIKTPSVYRFYSGLGRVKNSPKKHRKQKSKTKKIKKLNPKLCKRK